MKLAYLALKRKLLVKDQRILVNIRTFFKLEFVVLMTISHLKNSLTLYMQVNTSIGSVSPPNWPRLNKTAPIRFSCIMKKQILSGFIRWPYGPNWNFNSVRIVRLKNRIRNKLHRKQKWMKVPVCSWASHMIKHSLNWHFEHDWT